MRAIATTSALLILAGAGISTGHAEDVAPASIAEKDGINPLSSEGLGSVADFIAKPLFVPSRTAPAKTDALVAPAVQAATAVEAPKIQVVGIVRTPREFIAQIVDLADQSRYSVREGDFIGAWVVGSIDTASLKMRMDGRDQSYNVEAAALISPPANAAEGALRPAAAGANDASPEISDADRVGFFGKDAVPPRSR